MDLYFADEIDFVKSTVWLCYYDFVSHYKAISRVIRGVNGAVTRALIAIIQ